MFLFNKFRVPVDCNFVSVFVKYIERKYGSEKVKHVNGLISDLNQFRTVCGSLNPKETNPEKINLMILNCIQYAKALKVLSNKIPVGKGPDDLNIKFTWKEVSKDDKTTFPEIEHEICSVKYNLAVCFFLLGKLNYNSSNIDLVKESMKNFERAAYTIKEIKEISSDKLRTANIPDFYENYLDGCYNFLLGMALVCVYRFASSKKVLPPEKLMKVTMGISKYFSHSSRLLSNTGLDRAYLNYNAVFFKIQSYILRKDYQMKEFNQYAKGMGMMIGLCKSCEKMFEEIKGDAEKVKKEMNISEFDNVKSDVQWFLNKYVSENERIYRDPVVSEKDLPKIEEDTEKVKPIKYEDDVEDIQSLPALNSLVPPELDPLVSKYLCEMQTYFLQRIGNSETDESVNRFLFQRNLPGILNTGVFKTEISDAIFAQIQSIINQGGLELLKNNLKQMESISGKVEETLNSVESRLGREREENNKYQLMYGDMWKVSENPQYINQVQNLRNKIQIAKDLDYKIKEGISDNLKYYEILGLPKNMIEAQIPSSLTKEQVEVLPSTKSLKASLEKLNNDKGKLVTAFKSIFQNLNNNIPVIEFQNILKGTRNESLMLSDSKKAFEKDIKAIEELNSNVLKDYTDIDSKIAQFKEDCGKLQSKPNEEAVKFFNFLNNAQEIFSQTINNLNNSLKFYGEFDAKLSRIREEVENYLVSREIERNDLLEMLQSNERWRLAQNSVQNK